MGKVTEENVKSSIGCAIASKKPSVKFTPWPKTDRQTDRPWSRLHIYFAGPMKGQYYLIVVNNFLKWPEVMKYTNTMCSGAIRFLYELC